MASYTPKSDGSQDFREPFLLGSINDYPRCFTTCPSATTTIAYSEHFDKHIVIAVTCKRWGCRYCGQKNSVNLASRVTLAKPNKLITLTVNPAAYNTPREAFNETRRKLSELSKIIRKENGEFEYLRVLEVTKKGWPHYHLVARSPYIKQKWISSVWNGLTGAPIVDIRQIKKVDHVYSYVMKYLCKQTYIPWTNRRISWSKKFFPPKEKWTKGLWKLTNKVWSEEHPSEVIRWEFQDRTCQKVAADAWVFDPGEDTLKEQVKPKQTRSTAQNLAFQSPAGRPPCV